MFDSLLRSFMISGIVKGPGIADAVKLIEHQFYKKPDESDQKYAFRMAFEMAEILGSRDCFDWVFDPHSYRLYVVELWAFLFNAEKKHNDDEYVKESYRIAFEKIKTCNATINIIPIKLYTMKTNRDKYLKIISEYYLMWFYGIILLLCYGYLDVILPYDVEPIELDSNDRHQMSLQFRDKLNALVDTFQQLVATIFPEDEGVI